MKKIFALLLAVMMLFALTAKPVTASAAEEPVTLKIWFHGSNVSPDASKKVLDELNVYLAEKIGVSPYPICMIITLAGAASYATPFAAPQNMIAVGWTQYKFIDFIKIGIPMVLITYIAVVGLIPIFLPY